VPELPDVEGFRRVAAEHATGRTIRQVTVVDQGVLTNSTAGAFVRALRGRRVAEPRRHGKWLVLATDAAPTVMIHFGMTGSLRWCDASDQYHPHDRVVFDFDEGQLRYRDMRKLTGMRLVHGESAVCGALHGLGPDAAAIGREDFRRVLHRRRGSVKSALMDQVMLAGLGNLLVDETLWQARIRPDARAGELDSAQLDGLHRAMGRTVRSSIRAERVPARRGWLTGVRGRPQARCPRCDRALVTGKVAGRTTVWCSHCQS
jgi:formamidopyrimidine-DNA glycosylase